MVTLPLKASRKRNLLFIFCGQKDFAQCHSLWDTSSIWWQVFCKTSSTAIHVWCKKFACGWESVVDEKRPGRCVVLTTDATIATVASLMVWLACVSKCSNKFWRYAEKYNVDVWHLNRFHCWTLSFFWYSKLAMVFNTWQVVKEWAKYCTNWLCSMYTWRYNNDVIFIKMSLYTVNHKKGGSTFLTITLENLDRFL